MGYFYKYKWTPSKKRKREFAILMDKIDDFRYENGISRSSTSDSYYFTINDQKYRVSNHAVESRKGKVLYHDSAGMPIRAQIPSEWTKREKDIKYIHASKTRNMEIYNDLKAGYELDGFGCRKY